MPLAFTQGWRHHSTRISATFALAIPKHFKSYRGNLFRIYSRGQLLVCRTTFPGFSVSFLSVITHHTITPRITTLENTQGGVASGLA